MDVRGRGYRRVFQALSRRALFDRRAGGGGDRLSHRRTHRHLRRKAVRSRPCENPRAAGKEKRGRHRLKRQFDKNLKKAQKSLRFFL